MHDIDDYRSAKLLVDLHGAEASIHAAMRVDGLIEAGDVYGVAMWKCIMRVVEDLLSAPGGTVN